MTNSGTKLSNRIANFYDASSQLWEEVWGEHMHHGYYGSQGTIRKDRYQAQIDLIEELLSWAGVTAAQTILDAGCGIGGSTLYLAQKFQAHAIGITLSPKQAERACARAQEQNINLIEQLPQETVATSVPTVTFQVQDALNTGFPDNTFDFIWSLESGEHMPDKQAFLAECYRQLKPGGKLLMATWCHRPTNLVPLTQDDQRQLAELYRVYHLPYVISLPEYIDLATDLGFQNIRSDDWSRAVEPFWQDVILSALNPMIWPKILSAGWPTIQGAFAVQLMDSGFRQGLIRYGLMCGEKSGG